MPDEIARWERSLVARLEAGDDIALAAMFDQYGAMVFGAANRMVGRDVATDIVREVFHTAWRDPGRLDPDAVPLRIRLVTEARRRSVEWLRNPGPDARPSPAPDAPLVAAPNVEEAAAAMLAGERLRGAVDRLPEPNREAVELAYFRSMSFREVAERTRTAETTARSRVRVGMQRLAGELRATDEVERA